MPVSRFRFMGRSFVGWEIGENRECIIVALLVTGIVTSSIIVARLGALWSHPPAGVADAKTRPLQRKSGTLSKCPNCHRWHLGNPDIQVPLICTHPNLGGAGFRWMRCRSTRS